LPLENIPINASGNVQGEVKEFINQHEEYCFSFQDPVEIYMQSKWGKEIFVHTFIRKGFKSYRYELLNYLYLSSPPILLVFKDESKM